MAISRVLAVQQAGDCRHRNYTSTNESAQSTIDPYKWSCDEVVFVIPKVVALLQDPGANESQWSERRYDRATLATLMKAGDTRSAECRRLCRHHQTLFPDFFSANAHSVFYSSTNTFPSPIFPSWLRPHHGHALSTMSSAITTPLSLGQEIDRIFAPAIDFSILLPTEPFDFRDSHPSIRARQRLFDSSSLNGLMMASSFFISK